MPKLSLEINIMTPMTTIALQAVVLEKHGLLLRNSFFSGHFLAEVAFSQTWDRITFLNEPCQKAEFPQGSCREPDAELFSLESESWVVN